MKYGNGRLIYDGVRETFNGKIEFMEEILQTGKGQEEIARRLVHDEKLRKKLRCLKTPLSKGTMLRFELGEKDLETLFDALCHDRFTECLNNSDEMTQIYGRPLLNGEQKINLDITGFVLHAIVMNEICREKMEKTVTEREEYYDYWETSDYHYPEFETCVPAEYIWDLRLLVGIVEKLRKEEFGGKTYRLFMEIIYAGYRYLMRLVKGKECISGKVVKELIKEEWLEKNNVFPLLCRVMLLLVIADDVQVPVVWDYDMILILRFYEMFSELKKAEDEEKTQKSVALPPEQVKLLANFDEKYKTHNSLTEFSVSPVENAEGHILFGVMGMFGLNPRKFEEYALSEGECSRLLGQCGRWDAKKYGYMMIIAHLCKYIHHLEQKYVEISKDSQRFSAWKAKQEQQIRKLQKQPERSEEKIQERTQEPGALRTYIYLLGEEGEDLSQKVMQSPKDAQMGNDQQLFYVHTNNIQKCVIELKVQRR